MSDRALLDELLNYILNNEICLYVHDIREKAKEIRTRMAEEKDCKGCIHNNFNYFECQLCTRYLENDGWGDHYTPTKEKKDGN